MTEHHLKKILKETVSSFSDNNFFERLYAPEYLVQQVDECHFNSYMKKALCFDYKRHNLEFVLGTISCAGVTIILKSERFEKIVVQIFYDFHKKEIINYVLAHPKYTAFDWIDKKQISHKSNKVTSDRTLINYFNRMYQKFECPILN